MSDRPASPSPHTLAHPLIIAAGVFSLVIATCLPRGGLLPNELETLVYAKHWLHSDYIAGDWRLDMHPGPRLPFIVVLAPLIMLLPLEQVSWVGAMLGYALLALGLGVLFAWLGLTAIEAVAVVGFSLFLDHSLTAGEFIFGNVEGKVPAYALVFVAVAAASGGSLAVAGALLGLATTMHVIVGGWSTLFVAFAILMTRRGDGKQRAAAIGAYAICAMPGALAVLASQPANSASLPPGLSAEWIYVYLRVPHHLDPRSFVPRGLTQHTVEMTVAGFAALASIVLPRFLDRDDPRLFVTRFLQGSVLIAIVGAIAGFIPGGERFLLLYPFRVADTLVPLLGLAIVFALATARMRPRPLGLAVRAGVAVAAVVLAIQAQPRFGPVVPPDGFEPVARFIAEQAPVGVPVLISPHMDFAGYWMERPVVGLWKFAAHDPSGIAEWYARMVDLAAIAHPSTPGDRPRRRRLNAFDRLIADDYEALAAKYGARYLVLPPRDDLRFPVAFATNTFAVYRVGSP